MGTLSTDVASCKLGGSGMSQGIIFFFSMARLNKNAYYVCWNYCVHLCTALKGIFPISGKIISIMRINQKADFIHISWSASPSNMSRKAEITFNIKIWNARTENWIMGSFKMGSLGHQSVKNLPVVIWKHLVALNELFFYAWFCPGRMHATLHCIFLREYWGQNLCRLQFAVQDEIFSLDNERWGV